MKANDLIIELPIEGEVDSVLCVGGEDFSYVTDSLTLHEVERGDVKFTFGSTSKQPILADEYSRCDDKRVALSVLSEVTIETKS